MTDAALELAALLEADPSALDDVILDARVDIMPVDNEDLWDYITTYYGFRIPRIAVCPGHCAPFDAMADLIFGRYAEFDHVWTGGRGSGKTLDFAIAEHILLTHFADTIVNVGAVEEQAQACFRYIQLFDGSDRFKHRVKRSIISRTEYRNGGTLKIVPATPRQVNGPHPRLACWDEFDQTPWTVWQEGLCGKGDTKVSTEYGIIQLQSIEVGARVWSLDNGKFVLKPVIRTWANGVKPTIRLALSSGHILGFTRDHPILTEYGWQAASEIALGTRLVPFVRPSDHGQEEPVLPGTLSDQATARPSVPSLRGADYRQENDLLPSAHGIVRATQGNERQAALRCLRVRCAQIDLSEALSSVLHRRAQPRPSAQGPHQVRALQVRAVRRSPISAGHDLSEVPHGRLARANYYRQGFSASESGAHALETKRKQAGGDSSQYMRRARIERDPAISHWEIQRGPLPRADQNGDRGSWMVSPSCVPHPERCRARSEHSSDGLSRDNPVGYAAGVLGDDAHASVWVVGVTAGPAEPVYDITVADTHNFIAEGVVVHNSMPITVNGRPPQTVLTSSLKYAYGPMIRVMEAAKSGDKALRIYVWCVMEIIQRCPPERHENGEGCKLCPLAPECLDSAVDDNGTEVLLPGPGKASRADGFMPIDDVIKKYQTLDEDTWSSQWRSKRPSVKGLVYPQFDDNIHVIDFAAKYDLGKDASGKPNRCHPQLPVFGGVDFGFTNASVIVYLQVIDRKIIAFAEDYKEQRTDPEMGADIINQPWYKQIMWLMGDPAAAGGREILSKMGIPVSAADNTKDTGSDRSGIKKIRWALKPKGGRGDALPPVLYIDKSCKVLISQLKTYHTAEDKDEKDAPEKPVKKDDHAPDALRYGVARLVKTPGSNAKK